MLLDYFGFFRDSDWFVGFPCRYFRYLHGILFRINKSLQCLAEYVRCSDAIFSRFDIFYQICVVL